MKMKVNYAIRDARRIYYIKKIDENEGNLKQTWKVLNHAMNRKCKTSNIGKLCIEIREICDPGDIAESLNDHFVSIGKKLAKEIPETEDPPTANLNELTSDIRFRFKYVTKSKVFSLITQLKNGKATGLHNLPNKVLKLSRYYISSSLANIFNASIKTRIFPDDLKFGKVIPIY